jgi:hypothetical protein
LLRRHGREHREALGLRQSIAHVGVGVQRSSDLRECGGLHRLPRLGDGDVELTYAGDAPECEYRVLPVVQLLVTRVVDVEDERVGLDE